MIRTGVITKLGHAIRVHSSDVTRQLVRRVDAQIEETIAYWAGTGEIGINQRLIMGLPRELGGMGLTRLEIIAPAAYTASVTAAMDGHRKVHKQHTLALVIYRTLLDARAGDVELYDHLRTHRLDGSDAGLSFCGVNVNVEAYCAMLRTYLKCDAYTLHHPGPSPRLTCRGCSHTFAAGGQWGQHVSNCVAAKGGWTTRRHNAVVLFVRTLAAEAGAMPDRTEPRDLAFYSCKCGRSNIPHAVYQEHRKSCTQATTPLHTSVAVHVMFCVVPTIHSSPPFGAVSVTPGAVVSDTCTLRVAVATLNPSVAL